MQEFKGKLGNYRIIQTKDQAHTLYSEFFGESCHSEDGAYQETLHNYIIQTQMQKMVSQLATEIHPYCILEVGFGLGIGLQATIDFFKAHFPQIPVQFFSFELDPLLVDYANTHIFNQSLRFNQNELGLVSQFEQFNIQVIVGDARETIHKLQKKLNVFHTIYQDAFSPKKNPRLWTVEWFESLYQLAHPEAYLSTYSASSSIRKALLEANWSVFNGEGYGHKRSMTFARKNGQSDSEVLKHLARSPVLPLYDRDTLG